MADADGQVRSWRPDWPCSVQLGLAPYRHGGGDPTFARLPDGAIALGRRTPMGPGTLIVRSRAAEGVIEGQAWGAGAEWLLDRLPRLLGADDDVTGFVPEHPAIVEAWRRHSHWRIGASDLVFESLLPAIIEQKVTGQEAFAGYRRLVRRFGEPAPGPADLGLRLAPTAEQVRGIPSWEWLRLPVDQGRSAPLLRAAAVASSLERAVAGGPELLDRALQALPGIGRWTSAETRSRALGDADAVSFGDSHVAKDIGWALIGREVDDDELEVLLEPYRGHRLRVQGLVVLGRLGRPRRGPRMAPRRHLPGGYT
ncbi:MAG: DNA-3-methyladenine glycosylase family protein [Marmoricola sp.]